MRALFDIVHPADVLFFKRPIETLLDRGDEVRILSRHKDVTCDLLDRFGFPHTPISRAGSGTVGLARELITRDIATLKQARAFRPEVMAGFGGVAISHAGKLTGIPSVSFYDSENATLQTRITWPFITALYVPKDYAGPTPEGRTTRLSGSKELSYFHPDSFKPDPDRALAAGYDPGRDNFFIRVVSWRANHDIGKGGWSPELLRKAIQTLSAKGKVHLSSELPLTDDLRAHAYQGSKDDIHHLLARCRMLVGESATMACEAGILGVPAIYAGRDFPGYTLGLEKAGLITNIREVDETRLMAGIDHWLATPPEQVRAARDAYVGACPDWAEAVIYALDKAALA